MNNVRISFLLILLTLFLFVFGYFFAGPRGALISLVVSLALSFIAYWRSGSSVLRRLGAKEINDPGNRASKIVAIVSKRARIPKPKLYLIPSKAPNALATGRDPKHGTVAVTEGLLELLDHNELEGVIAHEIAHIAQRDTLLQTLVASLAGAIGMLAGSLRFGMLSQSARRSIRGGGALFPILLASVLAPLAAAVIQLSISRSREFSADRRGGSYTNKYLSLAQALKKIERSTMRIDHDSMPEMAHLFIYSSFNRNSISALFSSHPSVAERVKRLKQLASTGGGFGGAY